MATVQDKRQSAGKYDGYVEANLAKARNRIRSLDLTVGVLGFLVLTLAYGLVMAILDRWLELPSLARQVAFGCYLLSATIYSLLFIVRPLNARVNPYYAARQVEATIPNAKNSVVNWLDLHEEPLPAAIHGALGARAAKDLAQVDLERAISGRRASWLGGAVALLFLTLFILLVVWGGRQFGSLLARNFAPFVERTIATRTKLEILRPEGGDATVPVDQSVNIAVLIDGRVPGPRDPDRARLLLRYQEGDPYEERPMERETGREWAVTVPAFQVQNGFWYKVAAGDAETPEHRVKVRSTPLLTKFDVAYQYRPYTGLQNETNNDPNLKGHVGTFVILTAHTNRTVRITDSYLELSLGGKRKAVKAEAVADDPQAMRFELVIEQDGAYRIYFKSVEGEENRDPMPYNIVALPDQVPQVELKKPGKDITLPANGVLKLEGVATDDFGVRAMALRMKIQNDVMLAAKPYRPKKNFRLVDGSYPKTLEYRDFTELDKLTDAVGKPVTLKPKTVIEYWVEASDACDFPGPNTGESKHYFVTIADVPQDPRQAEEQKQEAQAEQQKHEAQQDEQIQRENENRKDNAPPEEQPKPGEGDKNPAEKPMGGDPGKKPDDKPDPNKQGAQNGSQNNPDPDQQKRDEELQQQQDRLQKAIKQQQQDKGGNKGEPPDDKAGNKGDGKQQQQPDAGDAKGQNPGEQDKGNGQNKGGQQMQPDAGDGKDGGEDKDDRAGGPKGGAPQQGQAGDGKNGGQPEKSPEQGQGKGNGKMDPGELSRLNDNPNPGQGEKGQGKGGQGGQDQQRAQSKDDPMRLTRSQGKGDGQQGDKKDNAEAKGGDPKDGGMGKGKGGDAAQAKGEKKGEGEGGKETDPEKAEKKDVDRLAKKAKNRNQKRDPEARKDAEQAKRELERLTREARDPEVRQAAKKAQEEIEKLERENNEPPGEPKKFDPKEKVGECSECKGGGKNGGQKQGQGKGGGGGDGQEKGEKKGDGEGEKIAKGEGKGEGGDEQGVRVPGGGGPNGGDEVVQPPDFKPEGPPDPEHAKKAAELQLEEFKKKVNKKTLQDAKMSPEDWAKFLRDYPEMLKRRTEARQPEKLPGPSHGGPLPSVGATKVETGKGPVIDAASNGRGKAPPGFENQTRDFTRGLSDLSKTPEKK